MVKCIEIKDFDIYYGFFYVVELVNLIVEFCIVMVFIGLFGCGKLMVLWIFNCMYEVILGVYCIGKVEFDGVDLYGKGVDLVVV